MAKKDFKPPVRSSTLERQAKGNTPLPPVLKVGTLAYFLLPSGEQIAAWVIQNSMSPGGQTGSYLVICGRHESSDVIQNCRMKDENFGDVLYPEPRRINHSQLLGILEPELP